MLFACPDSLGLCEITKTQQGIFCVLTIFIFPTVAAGIIIDTPPTAFLPFILSQLNQHYY